MKIDGNCHCGFITYEAEIDPQEVFICNCTDCQSLSGSAFRTVAPTEIGAFKLLTGEPTVYIKTGDSGTRRVQTFCPQCGSPLYSSAVGDGPKVYNIRLGTARQRGELTPKSQYWSHSAMPWLDRLHGVPKIEYE